MDKLDVIEFLLKEIKSEKLKIKKYKQDYDSELLKNDTVKWEWYESHKDGSKTKIKEYLKTIRRLSLEAEKEMK